MMGDKTFSDFIRNATDEERARVYGEVMDKACEMQRKVMTGTEEGRRFLQQLRNDGNDEAADLIDTLASQLAEARDRCTLLDAYVKKIDGIIEEVGGVTASCINTYEDIKRAMLALKTRAEAAERRAAELKAILCEVSRTRYLDRRQYAEAIKRIDAAIAAGEKEGG